MRRALCGLLSVALVLFLTGCGQSTTIYDLVDDPAGYNGKEVTVQGQYLWKPGDPGMSVLVKGISTRDDGTDAQPLDTAVWLEGFPADVSANLHRPVDAVYGAVEVTGRFESGSAYGPNGDYASQLTVSSAKAIEHIERVSYDAPREVPDTQISVYDLAEKPETYNGQKITTRGFYFWTPATSGLLTVGVETEKPAQGVASGLNPQPLGTPISMEGFPPDLSAQLNVGPSNSFVWGLVDVTGTFQTGGTFGLNGVHPSQLIIERVEPIK